MKASTNINSRDATPMHMTDIYKFIKSLHVNITYKKYNRIVSELALKYTQKITRDKQNKLITKLVTKVETTYRELILNDNEYAI